jgi:hypothetical protein
VESTSSEMKIMSGLLSIYGWPHIARTFLPLNFGNHLEEFT